MTEKQTRDPIPIPIPIPGQTIPTPHLPLDPKKTQLPPHAGNLLLLLLLLLLLQLKLLLSLLLSPHAAQA